MTFKYDAIKPGMVIHCHTKRESEELSKHLQELGYEEGYKSTFSTEYCFVNGNSTFDWLSLIGSAAANNMIEFTSLFNFADNDW